jgi:uncharacterized membrane protein
MREQLRAEAARQFSQAADMLVDACRQLEQCGVDDPPIERLLQALEEVTRQVHQMHPPPERIQTEPADQAIPGCRIAAMDAAQPNRCG